MSSFLPAALNKQKKNLTNFKLDNMYSWSSISTVLTWVLLVTEVTLLGLLTEGVTSLVLQESKCGQS